MFFILSFLFLLLHNWTTGGWSKSCTGERAGTSGRGKVLGKGGRRLNMVQKCAHMYVNAKIIPVETTQELREGEMRRMIKEVNSCMVYLIHCKNLYKCGTVPPNITTIKGKKRNLVVVPWEDIFLKNVEFYR
jgi:hypothetical protein